MVKQHRVVVENCAKGGRGVKKFRQLIGRVYQGCNAQFECDAHVHACTHTKFFDAWCVIALLVYQKV